MKCVTYIWTESVCLGIYKNSDSQDTFKKNGNISLSYELFWDQ